MRTLGLVLALALVGCATSTARPSILVQLEEIHGLPATTQSGAAVPQLLARAEQLQADAEAAWKRGESVQAQALGERSRAAYAALREVARAVKAEQRLAAVQAELSTLEGRSTALKARQQSVDAELAELERLLAVERDAEVLAPASAASPEREAARRDAARRITAQARLYCAAAQLLGGKTDSLDTELESLDTSLAKQLVPTRIDAAWKARASCLEALTMARRPQLADHPATGESDALMATLSHAHLGPSRDERGVVVTLTSSGNAASRAAKRSALLEALSPIVKSYAGAMLVVTHRARSEAGKTDQEQAQALAKELLLRGAKQVTPLAVGARLPLLPPERPESAAANERTEIVFVTPTL